MIAKSGFTDLWFSSRYAGYRLTKAVKKLVPNDPDAGVPDQARDEGECEGAKRRIGWQERGVSAVYG